MLFSFHICKQYQIFINHDEMVFSYLVNNLKDVLDDPKPVEQGG
jgi:hypothetical protein